MKHTLPVIFVLVMALTGGQVFAADEVPQNRFSGSAPAVIKNVDRPQGDFIYNGDDSLAYGALVLPHLKQKSFRAKGVVPTDVILQKCAGANTPTKMNRCIRKAIRAND